MSYLNRTAVCLAFATSAVTGLAPLSSLAQTGSGSVEFSFTSFTGPMAIATPANANNPSSWAVVGLVDGQQPTPTGQWISRAGPNPAPGTFVDGYVMGERSIAAGTRAIDLRYDWVAAGSPGENRISFTPRSFSQVALGEDFVLGTLTFQNGFWFGSADNPAFNTPTDLGFQIRTRSADGAAFNQTISGVVRMTVHAPNPVDHSTLAGQQAEADWVTVLSPAAITTFGALRVYDSCCRPAGAASVGTVDVIARFNSLDLVSFDNAQGGFLTAGVAPLPVPEPQTWALWALGLAGVASALNRRRAGPR